jgi:hypothetical protein
MQLSPRQRKTKLVDFQTGEVKEMSQKRKEMSQKRKEKSACHLPQSRLAPK